MVEIQQITEALELAEAYRNNQPDKGLQLLLPAWEAYVQACLYDNTVQVKMPRLLFSLYLKTGANGLDQTIALADKYLQYSQVQQNELLHAEMLYLKSKALRYGGQYKPALALALQALVVFEKYGFEKGNYIEVVAGLTYNCLLLVEYENAFRYNRQHFDLAVRDDDKHQQAIALYYLSVLHGRIGNMHESVITTVQTIRFARLHNLTQQFISCHIDMAIMLDKLQKRKLAQAFFVTGIKNYENSKDEYGFIWAILQYLMNQHKHNNLDGIVAIMRQYDNVIERNYYGHYRYMIANYRLLALTHQGKLNEAVAFLPILQQALEHTIQPFERGNILDALSYYYAQLGDYKQAYEYCNKVVANNAAEYDDEHRSRLRSIHIRQNLADAKRDKQQTEQLAELKQQFLAHISHEIRSPMNAIIGLSGLLADEDLPPRQKEIAGIVRRSSENLLNVVNDVLDNAKIESGKFTIENVSFSLPDLLNDAIALLKHRADEKGITFLYEHQAGLPAFITGDPTRLRQVLVNLLNNAVKFTTQGSVTLSVKHIADVNGLVSIQFTVSDTGIGIPAELTNKIFSGYTQATAGTARRYGGTGLGLKISKELVQLMGGKLTVQSIEGKGSTFGFVLQFAIGEPPAATGLSHQFVYSGPYVFKFLVADDLEDNRYVFDMLLKAIFPTAQVTLLTNGQEAVDAIHKNNYDLIVMDIDMPVMNGIEAALNILALNPQQKILGSSANVVVSPADIQAYGFTGFLPKPFTRLQFTETLRTLLAQQL